MNIKYKLASSFLAEEVEVDGNKKNIKINMMKPNGGMMPVKINDLMKLYGMYYQKDINVCNNNDMWVVLRVNHLEDDKEKSYVDRVVICHEDLENAMEINSYGIRLSDNDTITPSDREKLNKAFGALMGKNSNINRR